VFLEKFFDTPQHSGQQPSQPALAYAAPESDVLENERKITSVPLLGLDSGTAVYDISAHTVYLPDGTKLEAHSGRGGRLDDPRYVHEHMRGATPPNGIPAAWAALFNLFDGRECVLKDVLKVG
jgi:hypothetical protein